CKRSETSRDAGRSTRTSKAASAQGQPALTLGTITEAQVQQLVEGMDAAMTRRDMGAMLGYLAADAVVEVEYQLPQGLQFKRFNKDEYAAHLRDAAELASAPDYRRENTQIVMVPSAHYAELTTT